MVKHTSHVQNLTVEPNLVFKWKVVKGWDGIPKWKQKQLGVLFTGPRLPRFHLFFQHGIEKCMACWLKEH